MENTLLTNLLNIYQILLTGCLGVVVWWLRGVSRKADHAKTDLLELKVHLAQEYATKEIVDKVEIRVIAALLDFKKDIKEELLRLFQRMEATH